MSFVDDILPFSDFKSDHLLLILYPHDVTTYKARYQTCWSLHSSHTLYSFHSTFIAYLADDETLNLFIGHINQHFTGFR